MQLVRSLNRDRLYSGYWDWSGNRDYRVIEIPVTAGNPNRDSGSSHRLPNPASRAEDREAAAATAHMRRFARPKKKARFTAPYRAWRPISTNNCASCPESPIVFLVSQKSPAPVMPARVYR